MISFLSKGCLLLSSVPPVYVLNFSCLQKIEISSLHILSQWINWNCIGFGLENDNVWLKPDLFSLVFFRWWTIFFIFQRIVLTMAWKSVRMENMKLIPSKFSQTIPNSAPTRERWILRWRRAPVGWLECIFYFYLSL